MSGTDLSQLSIYFIHNKTKNETQIKCSSKLRSFLSGQRRLQGGLVFKLQLAGVNKLWLSLLRSEQKRQE